MILIQNDTGLGANTGSVIVRDGTALEIGNSVTQQTGGLMGGLGIWGEHLILNGSGNTLFGDSALTILSNNAPATGRSTTRSSPPITPGAGQSPWATIRPSPWERIRG